MVEEIAIGQQFSQGSTNTGVKLFASIFILGEGYGSPLQYSRLGNPVDREAWWAVVHGMAQSRT